MYTKFPQFFLIKTAFLFLLDLSKVLLYFLFYFCWADCFLTNVGNFSKSAARRLQPKQMRKNQKINQMRLSKIKRAYGVAYCNIVKGVSRTHKWAEKTFGQGNIYLFPFRKSKSSNASIAQFIGSSIAKSFTVRATTRMFCHQYTLLRKRKIFPH